MFEKSSFLSSIEESSIFQEDFFLSYTPPPIPVDEVQCI